MKFEGTAFIWVQGGDDDGGMVGGCTAGGETSKGDSKLWASWVSPGASGN
jgi:hypothetical protein